MEIKEILAKNLTLLRKSVNITQAEFAEKLNYSDKAISKWERAEAVPEIGVLKQIADFYGVTIDYLIKEHREPVKAKHNRLKKVFIPLLSVGIVWLVATLCYALFSLLFPNLNCIWLVFIYAIPISATLFLIFSSIWGRNVTSGIFTTIIVWGVLLSIYLSLEIFLKEPPTHLWLIFLIGIPLQIIIFLWFFFLTLSKKHKLNK